MQDVTMANAMVMEWVSVSDASGRTRLEAHWVTAEQHAAHAVPAAA